LQNHIEIVRDVRGRMTHFDLLTPEIVEAAIKEHKEGLK